MKDADIIICKVENGVVVVQDSYALDVGVITSISKFPRIF